MVFCFFPDTNARWAGRPARGRRTCTSVPSIRRLTPSAVASANTSASLRNLSSPLPGAANPRAASGGRTSEGAV